MSDPVLIIGAGIGGLSAALALAERALGVHEARALANASRLRDVRIEVREMTSKVEEWRQLASLASSEEDLGFAQRALEDLRAGRFDGAAVLTP